ncbi:MAG: hypothetical protein N3A38_14620 [Planctomycetota bacterium]|nr:hypothetical protein [Planctomycetota bacterium]
MSQGSARIDTPDVLKEFRNRFIAFDKSCRQAVYGIRADVNRVIEWIRNDRMRYWKEELKKREEKLLQARSAYIAARFGGPHERKPSYVEEEKALRKAEQRKAEAEAKLEAARRWSRLLDQETEKLMGPVNALTAMLDDNTPKALARLETMIVSLERYFSERPAEPPPAMPT